MSVSTRLPSRLVVLAVIVAVVEGAVAGTSFLCPLFPCPCVRLRPSSCWFRLLHRPSAPAFLVVLVAPEVAAVVGVLAVVCLSSSRTSGPCPSSRCVLASRFRSFVGSRRSSLRCLSSRVRPRSGPFRRLGSCCPCPPVCSSLSSPSSPVLSLLAVRSARWACSPVSQSTSRASPSSPRARPVL